ncbi:MAG: V-type ATP synthase subunit D [Arenicellales bacterium]
MPEAPSKTRLLEQRAERAMVREGKSVLEDRRDLLAHMLIEQVDEAGRLSAQADRALSLMRRLLRRAILRHGVEGLVVCAVEDTGLAAPHWRIENRLGTPWLSSGPGEAAPAPEQPGVEAGLEESVELAGARRTLRDLLAVLARLAAVENNLVRLVDVFRRTQRRVNALEHIVLPELNHAIKEMEDRMDEIERDDLVRSLLIKRHRARTGSETISI